MNATRIYQTLLRLYPRAFRETYGDEMTRVFQENLKHEGSSLGFWTRVAWDALTSSLREKQLGGTMLNRFAAICCIVICLITSYHLIFHLQYTRMVQVSTFENVLRPVLHLVVVAAILVRPAPQRNITWWLAVGCFVVSMVFSVGFQGDRQPAFIETINRFGGISLLAALLFATLALSTIKKDNARYTFPPIFWGLSVMCAQMLVTASFNRVVVILDNKTLEFSRDAIPWLTASGIAFATSYALIAISLWSAIPRSPDKPQLQSVSP